MVVFGEEICVPNGADSNAPSFIAVDWGVSPVARPGQVAAPAAGVAGVRPAAPSVLEVPVRVSSVRGAARGAEVDAAAVVDGCAPLFVASGPVGGRGVPGPPPSPGVPSPPVITRRPVLDTGSAFLYVLRFGAPSDDRLSRDCPGLLVTERPFVDLDDALDYITTVGREFIRGLVPVRLSVSEMNVQGNCRLGPQASQVVRQLTLRLKRSVERSTSECEFAQMHPSKFSTSPRDAVSRVAFIFGVTNATVLREPPHVAHARSDINALGLLDVRRAVDFALVDGSRMYFDASGRSFVRMWRCGRLAPRYPDPFHACLSFEKESAVLSGVVNGPTGPGVDPVARVRVGRLSVAREPPFMEPPRVPRKKPKFENRKRRQVDNGPDGDSGGGGGGFLG